MENEIIEDFSDSFCENRENDRFSSREYTQDQCHSAAQNVVVLSRIFELLKYEDIKNCRLVCSHWRNIAEYEFRKQSRISLIVLKDNEAANEIKITEAVNILSSILHNIISKMPDIPAAVAIKPIKFTSEQILSQFLLTERENIEDLRLPNLNFRDSNGEWIRQYDIKRLIGEKNIWLTKLKIFSYQFVISPMDIPLIEDLHLSNCTIVLDGGRIVPKKVYLSGIRFITSDGEKYENTFVNEFIDFHQIHTLKLYGSESVLKINIDMSNPNVSVKYLSLNCISVDWENSKWDVGELELCEVPFLSKTQMKIRALKVKGTDKEIDLSALPTTIERICLHETTICSSPICLPNLKHLHIWNTRCASLLPHFSNCNNLESLELTYTCDGFKIDVSDIPRNVKNIKVHSAGNWLMGNKTFTLRKLVLGWKSAPGIAESLRILKPEHLVIHGYFKVKDKNHKDDISALMKLISEPFKSVAVGYFLWGNETLEEHPFWPAVEEKCGYYLFTNGKGRPIREYEFQKMNIV